MKLPSRRLHLVLLFCCGLLVVCFLVSPSGATGHIQQTPAVAATTTGAQSASTATNGEQRFAVTVTGAKGGFVAGLTRENFSVREGKTGREINYFGNGDLPASVGILVDVSGSVKPRTLEAAKYAAAKFIQLADQKNEYLIGEFSDVWRAWSGWREGATAAIDALNNHGDADTDKSQAKLKPHGPTALYDATATALDELAKRPNPRHVLLLITDGADNNSRLSMDKVRHKIKASDVQIYGIGIIESYDSNGPDIIGQAVLDELATNSGGWAYFPENKKDRKQLNEVIERIALELRHQYLIGFTPTNAAPAGKWNKVKIKLAAPDDALKGMSLRTREGYFSPATSKP